MNKTLIYHIAASLIFLLIASGCSNRFIHTVQQLPAPPAAAANAHNYTDSTITLAAGKHYDRGPIHTFFYGDHYRDLWKTPVQAKVLDIGTAKGGLIPLQMGGSRQTINMRMQNPEGIEYVVRSVDKEPASIFSEKMQRSYLAYIVRDATSATNPYGALTIPPMAKAIGIYYVEPELVYVPHDPRLGAYRDSIGGTLALLERRPDGDQSKNPLLGYAPNVKSTRSAITERLTDNDSRFDARFYLRARLLDMLVGDWSRHEGNWRWAEFEYGNNAYTYKAVPRDRDNAYYKFEDGLIPWFFKRLGFKPHFQTFRKNLKQVEKLNLSGRNLDELILADLEWQDWKEVTDSVHASLTDEVLEEAMRAMPENIYALTGPTTLEKLKNRRDQLHSISSRYFGVLAKEVVLVGSDKHEQFNVKVISEDEIKVEIYKTDKEGEVQQLISSRIVNSTTTKVVKLYGLNGDDHFYIKGTVTPNIKIQIWGGAGADTYKLDAGESKLGKKVYITDSTYSNTYHVDKHTSVKINDDLPAKEFDAEGWLLRYYLD
ncbi:hypothetical protein ABID22_003918 [Pontibacter aydingkolensis]|uniref:Uncharacterized protein n=1 Tax=Pontibacter aydingkolensis TaxID=1911536 RepID=A0ABS7CZU0_9BACT|nr:hypothetical protein [Pontibacter aydingkolensis]MBW7469201.1 hypothetical protein [Pontibacter aydingkolensis]